MLTTTDTDPPEAATGCDDGVIEYEQPPAWLTVNVCPAMVAVPVRAAPLFAWIVICTPPLPVPDAGLTEIHGALLDALQPQPAGAVRLTLVFVADADGDRWSGAIENEQFSPCETVNVRPPIVNVPDRPGPLFAATVNATLPFPVPLAPDVIESQLALLVAVQPQPLPAITLTEPVPPPAGAAKDDSDSDNAQPSPCVTVNVWPAAVMAPLLAGPVLRAAVNRTAPSPVPLAPDVIVSHGTADVADHAQPAEV